MTARCSLKSRLGSKIFEYCYIEPRSKTDLPKLLYGKERPQFPSAYRACKDLTAKGCLKEKNGMFYADTAVLTEIITESSRARFSAKDKELLHLILSKPLFRYAYIHLNGLPSRYDPKQKPKFLANLKTTLSLLSFSVLKKNPHIKKMTDVNTFNTSTLQKKNKFMEIMYILPDASHNEDNFMKSLESSNRKKNRIRKMLYSLGLTQKEVQKLSNIQALANLYSLLPYDFLNSMRKLGRTSIIKKYARLQKFEIFIT